LIYRPIPTPFSYSIEPTFVEATVEGFKMPWTLNPVERLMGGSQQAVSELVDTLDSRWTRGVAPPREVR